MPRNTIDKMHEKDKKKLTMETGKGNGLQDTQNNEPSPTVHKQNKSYMGEMKLHSQIEKRERIPTNIRFSTFFGDVALPWQ